MTDSPVRVIVVDDDPELQAAFIESLRPEVEAMAVSPADVQLDDIEAADLVLCDFKLDEWQRDDSVWVPADGVALAASFRSHSGSPQVNETPTAFALYSGHVAELSGGLPHELRPHVLARNLNLEWVFAKEAGAATAVAAQVRELAAAVHSLPVEWRLEAGANETTVRALFELEPEDADADRAWADVESCRPPIHELSTSSHGLALLRWLLQRVLPYPTFLWDDVRLALRLRVSPDDLVQALDADASGFDQFRFRGPLGSFTGRRWWRTLVESWLWRVTDGQSFDIGVVHESITEALGRRLAPLELAEPVVALEADLSVSNSLLEAASAIRIWPDDWPTFADQPWVARQTALGQPAILALAVDDTSGAGRGTPLNDI